MLTGYTASFVSTYRTVHSLVIFMAGDQESRLTAKTHHKMQCRGMKLPCQLPCPIDIQHSVVFESCLPVAGLGIVGNDDRKRLLARMVQQWLLSLQRLSCTARDRPVFLIGHMLGDALFSDG